MLALLAALCACQPEIGDDCKNASDCSVQEQRTCDTTYPGGYCTVLGCEANTCPDEAACIAFQSVVSVAPECASLQSRPRLERTVCMKKCSGDRECRDGYDCVDMARPNPWGASAVDSKGGSRVCALPPPPSPEGQAAICTAQPPLPPPPALDAGRDATP